MVDRRQDRPGTTHRLMRVALCGLLTVVLLNAQSAQAHAQDGQAVTIEGLLKSGWQIAGYSDTADGWSAFILFRHPDQPYLVQCRAGYDVMREKRVRTNCYELR
jgi:hypothetical protein